MHDGPADGATRRVTIPPTVEEARGARRDAERVQAQLRLADRAARAESALQASMVGRESSDKDDLPHLLEWRHYRHLEQGLESSLVALAVAHQRPSPQESETEESKAIAKAKARQAAQIKHANRKEGPKKGIYYPIAERSWRPRDSNARWVPDQPWEAHLTHLDASQSEPPVRAARGV
jgi:hypothetical protein